MGKTVRYFLCRPGRSRNGVSAHLRLPPCAWRLRDAQMRRRSGVAHRRLDGAHLKASAQDAAERTIAKSLGTSHVDPAAPSEKGPRAVGVVTPPTGPPPAMLAPQRD